MALTPGTRLGPYEVTAQIGAGGMGEVYRAHDTKLNRDVALKVLPEAFIADADRIARFKREAQVLAALNHPGIAAIYGFEDTSTTHALVMELVEGPTLADRIAQGPIPLDEALSIAKQIAEALEAAHEQGIIHRDLKPANIKVRDDGTVKVLDFGLAKAMEPASGAASSASMSPTITTPAMTAAGVILGTAAYMSPEQAKGKAVDKRADIWAFGCVLFEMLTGRRAFEGNDVADTLANVLKMAPDWGRLPAALPPGVGSALRQCLRKQPQQRLRDVGDVQLVMSGVFDAQAVAPSRRVWQRPVLLMFGALALTLIGTLVALSLNRPPQRRVARLSLPQPTDAVMLPGIGRGRRPLAIAPTGDRVALLGTQGLWIRFLGRADGILLPGTAGAIDPFFSPDGQSLAFFRGDRLYRIPVSGTAPVPIGQTAEPWGASWQADDTILFGQHDGVWRVPAGGGTPERLIPIADGEAVHGPRMLPGGQLVLFTLRPAGVVSWDAAHIVVQSLNSGERTVLVDGGRDAHYAPSGHLVYAVNNTLVAQAIDLDRVATQGTAVAMAENVAVSPGLTGAAMFDLADDGTLIYLTGRTVGELYRLAWVDRQGRPAFVDVPAARYSWPRLSPDGRKVAIEIVGNDSESAVWIVDLERGTRSRLTSGLATHPLWTRDGQYVVTTASDDGGIGLFQQRADGSGQPRRMATIGSPVRAGSWSKDGQLAFAILRGDDADVGILTTEGEPSWTPLIRTDGFEFQPQISPNGEWIAYTGGMSGRMEVYLQEFPALGARQQVTDGGARDPVWSADGNQLIYLTLPGADAPARVVSVSIDASLPVSIGAPHALFDYPDSSPRFGNGRQYDIHPDGQRFLMLLNDAPGDSQTPGGADLNIVLNWFTELERLVPVD